MASKQKSRWADEGEDSAEDATRRKREREEKRRLKDEKSYRSVVAQTTTSSQDDQAPYPANHDPERPSKRRKPSVEDEGTHAEAEDPSSKLLHFPTTNFGPCRDVKLFDLLNDIEEGSYGLVSRAREKSTGQIVALKRLKMDYAHDGFPVTGLREIQTLMASRHTSIVHLREVVMGATLQE